MASEVTTPTASSMRSSRATVGAEKPVRLAISRTCSPKAGSVKSSPITASRVRPSKAAPRLDGCKLIAYKCKLFDYIVKGEVVPDAAAAATVRVPGDN